jgi:hypothetical protein
MLLGDFSTNSSRTWRPLKLLPCAELGCCRIAPACRMSHTIGETRGTRKCHCWISRPRHSSLFSRAFVQGCGKIDLTELAYGGGVSLGTSWSWPDIPSSVLSNGKHFVFEQTVESDKNRIRLPATTDCCSQNQPSINDMPR